MQNPISDPATAARLATLSAEVDQAEQAAAAARAAVNGAAERASQLRTRTAEHRAAEPSTTTASMSEALASNPGAIGTAALDAELRAAGETATSGHAKWRLELEAMEGAGPIIAAEQDRLAEALDHAAAAHEAAWGAFHRAARAALALEAEQRLGVLYAEVLGPYEAMLDARRLDNAGPIASDNGPRLGLDAHGMTIWWPEPSGFDAMARGWRPIYPRRPDHQARADSVAAFRSALTSGTGSRKVRSSK